MKKIENLIKVGWIEFYSNWFYSNCKDYDTVGYIKESVYYRGKDRYDRMREDGTPRSGYDFYYEIDEDGRVAGCSVCSPSVQYIECFEDDRLYTGWGVECATGEISAVDGPQAYTEDEEGNKIYLVRW